MLAGALSFLLGLISCRGALESILLLALWIGFGWLITGITRADAAESSPYVPFRGWQIFGGIVLAIGAVVVIVWPLESLFALAVLSRVWLIVIGAWQVLRPSSFARTVPNSWALRVELGQDNTSDPGRLRLGLPR